MAPQFSLVTPNKKDWKHENEEKHSRGNNRTKMKNRVADYNDGQKIESNSNLQCSVFCNEICRKWRILVIEVNNLTADLAGHKVFISEVSKDLYTRMQRRAISCSCNEARI
ncbi:hypothetical protein ES703_69825 [subsurface metagenome]